MVNSSGAHLAALSMLLATAAAIGPAVALDGDLVLGYSAATTGPFSTLAKRNAVVAQIAVDEINAAGGVNGRKLAISTFDTGGKPDQAVTAIRHFAEDTTALAVIGPFSTSEVRVSFPAGERLGIAQMSMASSAPGVAKPFTFAFRNTMDEAYALNRLMRTLIRNNVPRATAAITYANDDAVSQSLGTAIFPAVLRAAEIAVRDSVSFRFAAFDLSPQVSQLVRNPTDLIAVGAPPETMLKLAMELRRQGHPGRMIAAATVSDWELPARMGSAGEGTLITMTFYPGLDEPRTKTFVGRFQERLRAMQEPAVMPNQFDAATYDIVYMYAEAMKRAKVSGERSRLADERRAVRDQLRVLKDFPAIVGPISIGGDGDAIKPVFVVEAQSGEWRLVDVHRD